MKNKVFILVFDGNEMKFTKISDSAMFIEGLEDLVLEYKGKLKVPK